MGASKGLAGYVHVGGQVYGPEDRVPADVANAITNPKAWAAGSTPEADDAASGEPGGYEALTKAELVEAIDARNEGREDEAKVSASGSNKADLIAALVADDAASGS